MISANEYRVVGPPGTGKTRYLTRQIERAVEKERTPLLTSLTRAAAVEIESRVEFGWTFGPDQVGTLHSHCFRALDRPTLVSTADHVASWNAYIGAFDPSFQLSLDVFGTASKEEAEIGRERHADARGDVLYNATLNFRSMLKPREQWPMELETFDRKFSEWRKLEGLHDFTDLIERCIEEVTEPPHSPDVIFVDEAQDHDPLELSLVRLWGKSVDQVIIAGDPDQSIFGFRGADPRAFYSSEIPPENEKILSQSWRVPKKVHAAAMKMIRRIEDRRDVEYLPTDEPGECIRRRGLSLRHAHKIVAEAERLANAGESVMILASCRFLLAGVLKSLREAGIPFANPYSPNNGAFNPLSVRGGVTSPQRLLAYLKPQAFAFGDDARLWTWGEFANWIDPLDVSGFLKHGAKKRVQEEAARQGDAVVSIEELRPFMDEQSGVSQLSVMDDDPLGWFRQRLNKSRAAAFEFPIEVVRHRGVAALSEPPKLIPGTIHSVKGGEADHVFLFPDLSPQGAEEMKRNPDAITRAFYVGQTRAKKALHLFDASRRTAIDWRD